MGGCRVSEEEALWAAIDAMPEDALRRLVLADWYDERAGVVECGCEAGSMDSGGETPWGEPVDIMCGICDGTGFIPDGRADLARALRATCDRVPWKNSPGHMIFQTPDAVYVWRQSNHDIHLADPNFVSCEIARHLNGHGTPKRHYYPTASAAIRDLCRAYIAVHCKSEVPA